MRKFLFGLAPRSAACALLRNLDRHKLKAE